MPARVLVVGCGGIGGVIAASLAELAELDGTLLSRPVVLVRDPARAAHIEEHGLAVQGVGATIGRPRVAGSPAELEAGFDFILLATQPTQLEDAALSVRSALAPGGALVCLQNGLCEERLARVHGEEAVIGAVVAFGATATGPGGAERTSAGGFVLGRLSGVADPRLQTLQTLLSAIGPAEISLNLRGARWSKLAINAAISSLGTVGGDRLGPLMRHAFIRRLALEIMSEVVAVAQAEGVTLEKVSGTLDLPWLALTEGERSGRGPATLMAKHAVLLAVGTRYRRLRSSMLAAIERGITPPVDFLNGEVVERGARHGIETPVNAAARALVHAIAAGDERSSLETARGLMGAIPGS